MSCLLLEKEQTMHCMKINLFFVFLVWPINKGCMQIILSCSYIILEFSGLTWRQFHVTVLHQTQGKLELELSLSLLIDQKRTPGRYSTIFHAKITSNTNSTYTNRTNIWTFLRFTFCRTDFFQRLRFYRLSPVLFILISTTRSKVYLECVNDNH